MDPQSSIKETVNIPPQPSKLPNATDLTSTKLLPNILSAICIIMIIGSSIIGYSTRKGQNLDKQRLDDFQKIQYSIDAYYTANGYKLPNTLTENLGNNTESSLILNDPETKKEYEYIILSNYSYQLCTNFATEKKTKQDEKALSSSYSYYAKIDHKKGHDCINYEIPEYSRNLNNNFNNGVDIYSNNPTIVLPPNATEQIENSNNTQRRSDVTAILNAIGQYAADHIGSIPSGITTTQQIISSSSVNICSQLAPTYIAALPMDPQLSTQATAIIDCEKTYNSGYMVSVDSTNNRVTVSAPYADRGVIISATR